MRGRQSGQSEAFVYAPLESFVPRGHPIRKIKKLVDAALASMDSVFEAMYAASGRPSIPPEQLLRALILQMIYSVRSERLLMEELGYNMLFRWFVGLAMGDSAWHPTTFTHNRDRLLAHDVDERFLAAVNAQAQAKRLLSKEHFSLDGTLLEACASIKSFRPKDAPKPPDGGDDGGGEGGGRRAERDFHGEKWSNATHGSTTDPDARLCRKSNGEGAKLSHMGHVLVENRNGLVVGAAVTEANGMAEREAGLALLDGLPQRKRRRTVGADRGYNVKSFVKGCRERRFTPQVALKQSGNAIDGRTTRHGGYKAGMTRRKRVEEPFGWGKAFGLLRKLRHRGQAKVQWQFRLTMAAYNVVALVGLGL